MHALRIQLSTKWLDQVTLIVGLALGSGLQRRVLVQPQIDHLSHSAFTVYSYMLLQCSSQTLSNATDFFCAE
jgi:hypothetical protein